jgi:hypothetical protein
VDLTRVAQDAVGEEGDLVAGEHDVLHPSMLAYLTISYLLQARTSSATKWAARLDEQQEDRKQRTAR